MKPVIRRGNEEVAGGYAACPGELFSFSWRSWRWLMQIIENE